MGHTGRFYWVQGQAFEYAFAFHRGWEIMRWFLAMTLLIYVYVRPWQGSLVRKKRGGSFEVGEWQSLQRMVCYLKTLN